MIPDEIFHETVLGFFAPVRKYLDDATCSEIMINRFDEIYIERKGKLHKTDAAFPSAEALEAAVRNIAQFVGKSVDGLHPILEARLPDGSRVEAVIPPASRRGITIAIRRFPKDRLTMEKLIDLGALTQEASDFLHLAVELKKNVIVAGGTGSGKTSLLNALGSFIPEDERVVIIEDSSEIQLQQPHAVYLEARPPDPHGRGEVTIRSLLRATLRLRPDRIVLGEIRAGEALDLLQAMTSGHGGCLTTLHATHSSDTLHRLETMGLMSEVELPLEALRHQVGSAVEFIVHTDRFNDGSRKLTAISECIGYSPESAYTLNDVFRFEHEGRDEKTGRILGVMKPTRSPTPFGDEILAKGYELPPNIVATGKTRGRH